MSLDIAQSNIDNLTLGVVPVFEVAGQVEWDGTPPHNDRLKEAAINLRFQYIGKGAARRGLAALRCIPVRTVDKFAAVRA